MDEKKWKQRHYKSECVLIKKGSIDKKMNMVYIYAHKQTTLCQSEPINQRRRNVQQHTAFSHVLLRHKVLRYLNFVVEKGVQSLPYSVH